MIGLAINSEESLVEIDPATLPLLAQEIISLIGISQTLKLMKARGGVRTPIPYKASHTCQLASIINISSVRCLVQRYAGELLEIPKADSLLRQLRNKAIAEDYEENDMSHAELALKYNLSRGGIRKILKSWNKK